MSHNYFTTEEKQYFDRLARWQRMRYLNYSNKKQLTRDQALENLKRKNPMEQTLELDKFVDSAYHSSNEPRLPSTETNRK